MSSAPQKNKQRQSNTSPGHHLSETKHGGSFRYNPQAKEFVPGGNDSNMGKQNLQKQETQNLQRGGRKIREQRGRGKAEGGLSKAFRNSNEDYSRSTSSFKEPDSGTGRSKFPETPILGKSPSRHVSANHLLNFQHYQPQQRKMAGQRGGRSGRRSSGSREPYNANKFLQANFKFLVSDAADLRAHSQDADLMLDWGDVLEVEMLVPAPLKCPITLESPPLCPQITPCGHVFSFPGIMAHLITNGGDALRKASPCPLCNAPVAARELRLVRVHISPQPQVGQQIQFRLLKRLRAEIIPHIVEEESKGELISEASESSGLKNREEDHQRSWQTKIPEKGSVEEKEFDLEGLGYNQFAKFTQIKDAPKLWELAAKELAKYGAQVMEEGGLDAAQEAPFIFGAIDALASRAASWAERRQRTLQERNILFSEKLSPEDAATSAAQAVKKITNAAVLSASKERKMKAEESSRLSDFPSLASSSSDPQSTGQAMRMDSVPEAMNFESAFSEEDSPRQPNVEKHFSELNFSKQEGRQNSLRDQIENFQSAKSLDKNPSGFQPTGVSEQNPENANRQTEFYFYQAASGQWIFIHPLLMRILLHQYGSYDKLPKFLTGILLELEPQKQTELLRKRQKFLGHLPLGGMFDLAEIDLSGILSSEALEPFQQELSARNSRREARLAEDRRIAEEDTARMMEEENLGKGPSAAELQAMPLLGGKLDTGRTESEDLTEAVALSLMGETSFQESTFGSSPPPAPPQDGISFAHMARMGFAASGPSLSSSSPAADQTAWAQKFSTQGDPPLGQSFPPKIQKVSPPNWSRMLKEKDKPKEEEVKENPQGNRSKKGGKRMVLLGMPNRKY